MRVGFDIDDTITRKPEFFALLSQALVAAGHEVFILTFRTNADEVAALMGKEGIAFTQIIVCGCDTPPEGFTHWKANRVRELGLHVYFEDMTSVVNKVGENTLVLMPVSPRIGAVAYVDPE